MSVNDDKAANDLFDEIVQCIKSSEVTPETKISDETRLRLYGLYKQATEGNLHNPENGEERPAQPSRWNLVAYYKYDAWEQCENMTKAEAMIGYAQLAAAQENIVGEKCLSLLKKYESRKANGQEDESKRSQDPEDQNDKPIPNNFQTGSRQTYEETSSNNTIQVESSSSSSLIKSQYTKKTVWEKYFGISPIIPRGQLDISNGHLIQTLLRCFYPNSIMPSVRSLQNSVTSKWGLDTKKESVVCGLSVRSLWDLFLNAASFSSGSEIIIVPPINISGMIQIMQYHDIHIVPVDIPLENDEPVIKVNYDAVKSAITTNTVAIMVVHPFGLVCTGEDEMKALYELCSQKGLLLIEDCAECYSGYGQNASSYTGSQYSDVRFFSFGTIKTTTCLGGGLMFLRNSIKDEQKEKLPSIDMKSIVKKMMHMQQHLFVQQSNFEFSIKIIKCMIIRFICTYPLLYGFLIQLLRFLGYDYNKIFTSSIRGFHPSKRESLSTFGQIQTQKTLTRALIRQIRKRPSPALLYLLQSRLLCSNETNRQLRSRIKRCHKMKQILSKYAPTIKTPIGSPSSNHLFWLFPVIVNNPDEISKEALKHSFDIPRGTSQLDCVTNLLKSQNQNKSHSNIIPSCINTETLMNKILYLPIPMFSTNENDMIRIAKIFTNPITSILPQPISKRKKSFLKQSSFWLLLCLFFTFILVREPKNFFRYIFFTLIGQILHLFFWISIVVGFSAYSLRLTCGSFYITASKTFATYSSMLVKKEFDSSKCDNNLSSVGNPKSANGEKSSKSTENLHGLDLEEVCQFDALQTSENVECKTQDTHDPTENMALVTGATGFIGSLLLRDLLLHRTKLNIQGGVILICRSKNNISCHQRIKKLLSDPMYSFLDDEEKEKLVTVIEGDVTSKDIGLSKKDLDLVCNSLHISHIYHCAASVSFTQTLEEAAMSNITSAIQMQEFCTRLKESNAKYVFISTAFIHSDKKGNEKSPLPEELFSLDPFDPAEIYRSMLTTQTYASNAMMTLNFPNTYTFSKCVAENLLMRSKIQNTIIIRPSIVGPSIQEPYEGWAGKKPSTLVAAVCLYLKFPFNIWSFKQEKVPVIPVDVLCRFIIAKTLAHKWHEDEDSFENVFFEGNKESYFNSIDFHDKIKDCHQKLIYNAAWNTSSSPTSQFLWYDYALTAVHHGVVKGHINRVMAYVGVLVTVKFFPAINVSFSTFALLHKYFVQTPLDLFTLISQKLGINHDAAKLINEIRTAISLPVLFYPFTNATFHFQSELVAPSSMDGKRYMFSCVLAASNFIEKYEKRAKNHENKKTQYGTHSKFTSVNKVQNAKWKPSVITVGGSSHKDKIIDSVWAITQPRGNGVFRLAGWFLRKMFRWILHELTVDIDSFANLFHELKELNATDTKNQYGSCIVFVPTHRSFLDFIILSYIVFALPELQLELPKIAAANDFSRLPILGKLAAIAGAFFIKRGQGKADPDLERKIRYIKGNFNKETAPCIEVFIEGQRSRDRRFLKPRTGFLRCLKKVGGKYIFFPISINYEQIPEHSVLSQEANGKMRRPFRILSLLRWLKDAFLGKIELGRIHVAAAAPLLMDSSSAMNISLLANSLQRLQQKQIFVSEFHIAAGAKALNLDPEILRNGLKYLGCNFWPSYETTCDISSLSKGSNEVWSIFLQVGHFFAPFFIHSHPQWASWLNPSLENNISTSTLVKNDDVSHIVYTLGRLFDTAEKVARETLNLLNSKGFHYPTIAHAMQYTTMRGVSISQLLLRVAMSSQLLKNQNLRVVNAESMQSRDSYLEENDSSKCNEKDLSIEAIFKHSDPSRTSNHEKSEIVTPQNLRNKESFGSWGYQDSGFVAHYSSDGTRCVTMKGNRYNLSGRSMPRLISFLEHETGVRIKVDQVTLPLPINDPILDKSDLNEMDLSKLLSVIADDKSRLSTCQRDRARHGTGQSQEDMYLIRTERLRNVRMPDAVIWPKEEKEIEALMVLATKERWCIVPFGGGTNVTHALHCPSKNEESRPIISVDMRLMNKILWINEEDNVAHVQAGITGADLADAMMYKGYTIGHEPDSIEFSTLGGWVATKASGMKQNKYGNIENIVKNVFVVSPTGILWQQDHAFKSTHGRVSTGTDLSSLMLGSEGNFGIITSVVIRIFPLPEVKDYESIIFPTFYDGFGFVRDIAKLGALKPASVRLLDNDQFRLGQALKKEESFFGKISQAVIKTLANTMGKFEQTSIVCTTIIFEGSHNEVSLQKKTIKALANTHNGILAGSNIGKSGYDLTFAIAYLRDFALSHYFLAESFETFVPWSLATEMIRYTKERIFREHKQRALPGLPLLSCRITQLYDEGVCVYFYFCMYIKDVPNPHESFMEIECAAREEILDRGGSLSHHHGIGKLRARYMSSIHSSDFIDMKSKIKSAFDPENILASRNGSVGV